MLAAVDRWIAAERDRWVPWAPDAFGIGVAVYFSLAAEPPPAAAWIAVAGGLAVRWMAVRAGMAALEFLGCGAAIAGVGLAAALYRADAAGTPMLNGPFGPLKINGRVADYERTLRGDKLTLDVGHLPDVPAARTPRRLRVTLKGNTRLEARPPLGAAVEVLARVSPPPPPAMPGAYDFQRHAFFQGIGGYGFVLARPRIRGPPDGGWKAIATRAVSDFRHRFADDIVRTIPGVEGAVTVALLTGIRGWIPEETLDAMRDAGVAHLLAISGLHVGLVAGTVFVGLRLALALLPGAGRHLATKKQAALLAGIAAFGYALAAGFSVPTERAFLMLSLLLAGVLLDRRAVSLRSVAWAALAVLAAAPESLATPGFQMSFAAATALIAAYGSWAARRRRRVLEGLEAPRRQGPLWTALRYVWGVLGTTCVAGAATAPFAIHHFQHVAGLGTVVNAVAVPLAALWIIPAGFLALVLQPFGLSSVPLQVMAAGIRMMLAAVETAADWPSPFAPPPTLDVEPLALLVLGALWLILWRGRPRWLGAVAMVAALPWAALSPRPDIVVDGRARAVGIVDTESGYGASSVRRARFETETWGRLLGRAEEPRAWPTDPERPRGGLRCDAIGCSYETGNLRIAIVFDEAALEDDCRSGGFVISLVPARGLCRRGRTVDRFDLWRMGTHALYFAADTVRVETVAETRGRRPWVPLREKNRRRRDR